MMNALILKGAAPIIARAMADEMDVVVKFHDGPPCTAKKVIYLPQLPINDPNAAAMTRFHIGHEAGHIAHTDEDCPAFIANRNERLHRLWNCLEDIFMESCQIRKFPGYKSFISQGMKAMEGKLLTPQEGDSWSVVEAYLLTIGYRDGLGIKSVNDYFAVCEKAGVDLFPAGLLNALNAAAIGARSLNDTSEVFQLAERLLSIIDNPPPPEPSPPPESKPDSDPSQDTEEESDDDSDGERQPSTGEGGRSSPAPGDPASPAPGAASQDGPTANQQAALDQLKDEPTEPYKGFGEMLRDAIEDVSDDVPVESRLDPDYMNYKVAKPYKDQSAIARVTTVSNKARLRCREQMLSVRRAERTYHASGSRLSARKVTNIMRGDYRVFERISEGVNTNCAVQILLDASGSMNTFGAMEVARDTALALAAALQAIDGVDVSIASFPSVDDIS